MAQTMSPCLAAFFGQMSLDQTGTHACQLPWVTRPIFTEKSIKVGKLVIKSSCDEFFGEFQYWDPSGGMKISFHSN